MSIVTFLWCFRVLLTQWFTNSRRNDKRQLVIYKSCSAALWSRSFCTTTIITFDFWETQILNWCNKKKSIYLYFYSWLNGSTYTIARKFFFGKFIERLLLKVNLNTFIMLSLYCWSNYFATKFFSYISYLGVKLNC